MPDVVQMHPIDAVERGELAHLAPQVGAHFRPGGTEPLVVAHVGRRVEAGLPLAADREPLRVVLLHPGVAVPVERPDPAVELETLGVGHLCQRLRIAASDQHTDDPRRP